MFLVMLFGYKLPPVEHAIGDETLFGVMVLVVGSSYNCICG